MLHGLKIYGNDNNNQSQFFFQFQYVIALNAFLGTPWQPEFCKWAFNVPRGAACLEKWNQIPANVDILISHTPPVGYGDLCSSNVRAGYVYRL